jgi:hypothetical protein
MVDRTFTVRIAYSQPSIWLQVFSILKCPKTFLICHFESKKIHMVPWHDLVVQKQLLLNTTLEEKRAVPA